MTGSPVIAVPAAAPQRMGAQERRDVDTAVAEVLRTGPYVGGPVVEQFERDLAAYVGTAYAVGVDNGSNALTIAMQALELREGVVVVPPNDGGFAAAAGQAAGLRPVVADVDPSSGLVTAATLDEVRDDRVVAVVVTHLHGMRVDVAPVVEWARQHAIAVVEDCAQAHGARHGDRHVGSHGDVATFSFYPTKNLGALGDAGAIVTDRPEVAERARSLRQYGWEPRFLVADGRGRNSRLDPLQAAVLSARLPHLEASNEIRRSVLRRYRRAAPSSTFLTIDPDADVVHHAVVRTPQRDALREHLERAGIAVDVHYPYLVQEMPGIELAAEARTPAADALRRECLSLPCFPGITDDEVAAVCTALTAWCSDGR